MSYDDVPAERIEMSRVSKGLPAKKVPADSVKAFGPLTGIRSCACSFLPMVSSPNATPDETRPSGVGHDLMSWASIYQ